VSGILSVLSEFHLYFSWFSILMVGIWCLVSNFVLRSSFGWYCVRVEFCLVWYFVYVVFSWLYLFVWYFVRIGTLFGWYILLCLVHCSGCLRGSIAVSLRMPKALIENRMIIQLSTLKCETVRS